MYWDKKVFPARGIELVTFRFENVSSTTAPGSHIMIWRHLYNVNNFENLKQETELDFSSTSCAFLSQRPMPILFFCKKAPFIIRWISGGDRRSSCQIGNCGISWKPLDYYFLVLSNFHYIFPHYSLNQYNFSNVLYKIHSKNFFFHKILNFSKFPSEI